MKRSLKKPLLKGAARDSLFGWFFVSPLILGVVIILTPVLVRSINFSFNTLEMQEIGYRLTPAGLDNYKAALLVDPDFMRNILTSLGTLLLNVPSIVIFSLFIAVLLNQDMPGKTVFRVIFFIPVILSVGYFVTMTSNDMLSSGMNSLQSFDSGKDGFTGFFTVEKIQGTLIRLNLTPSISKLIVDLLNGISSVINQSGVQILIFLAGLNSISPSVYESAKIEGATGWESFWKITVPIISPMIFVNILYSIINFFTGASNSIMEKIYTVTFSNFNYGLGAAMSWIYFAVIVVAIAAVALAAHRFVFYQEEG